MIGTELIAEMATNLGNAAQTEDDIRGPAEGWLIKLQEEDINQYMFSLIDVIINPQFQDCARSMGAILLYQVFVKRTFDQQRDFNQMWSELELEYRATLCDGLTSTVFNGEGDIVVQCANMLGAFHAIEFPLETFSEQMKQLLDQTELSVDPNVRMVALEVIYAFTQACIMINPNCGMDQNFIGIAQDLFQNLIAQMGNDGEVELQHAASQFFTHSISFFYRTLSFPDSFDALMSVAFAFIGYGPAGSNVTTTPEASSGYGMLFADGYGILRRAIDNLYPQLENYVESIIEQVNTDLQSGNEEGIEQACGLLSLLGEVEVDIASGDRATMKPRHREFESSIGLGRRAFFELFDTLTSLLVEVEECSAFEHTIQVAVFVSLADLALTLDESGLELIVGFVSEHINAEAWQLRLAAVLLLNVATNITSFTEQPSNLLVLYDALENALGDTHQVVVEIAMWSLGRAVEKFAIIVQNAGRFGQICEDATRIAGTNPNAATRAAWLVKTCVQALQATGGGEILAGLFGEVSAFLCAVADQIRTAAGYAYSALAQLIEATPRATAEDCEAVLQHAVRVLEEIVGSGKHLTRNLDDADRLIWVSTIIENITFLAGDLIAPVADTLLGLLLEVLRCTDHEVLNEALPAVGAIARSIGAEFGRYTEDVLPLVRGLLEDPECVGAAGLLVGDMYYALDTLPQEATAEFVNGLLSGLRSDKVSTETKVTLISVLATIVSAVGSGYGEWVDETLLLVGTEARGIAEEREGAADTQLAAGVYDAAIQVYHALLPVLAESTSGWKRVKSFFFIFDLVLRQTSTDLHVLENAIHLIGSVAELLGRPLHVILNSPTVAGLLECGKASDEENLVELATRVLELVQAA